MALAPGTSLGHYTVSALIGEGGMGQVWQATDIQLNRQVALKILPDAFADDPERFTWASRLWRRRCAGRPAGVLLVALIGWGGGLAVVAQAPRALFVAAESGVTQARPPADLAVSRTRLVRVEFGLLAEVRAAVGREPSAASTLVLNLFDDAVFTAVFERIEATASGYALTGRLEGVERGTVALVVNDDIVVGTVANPGGIYSLRSGGNGFHVITQIDQSRLPPESAPIPAPPPPGVN